MSPPSPDLSVSVTVKNRPEIDYLQHHNKTIFTGVCRNLGLIPAICCSCVPASPKESDGCNKLTHSGIFLQHMIDPHPDTTRACVARYSITATPDTRQENEESSGRWSFKQRQITLKFFLVENFTFLPLDCCLLPWLMRIVMKISDIRLTKKPVESDKKLYYYLRSGYLNTVWTIWTVYFRSRVVRLKQKNISTFSY